MNPMTDFSDIKGICFDLDDTLWDCAPVIERAEQRFYEWLDTHYPRITARYDYRTLIDSRIHHFGAHPQWHHNLTQMRKHWLRIVRAQWAVTRDALGAWRGEAARARLRGQLAGFFRLPGRLGQRRDIQSARRVPEAYIESLFTHRTPE